ncbi:uncharacterized protein HaLaN_01110 [Haematococcus lacustris]|uniref:Uncharacterized protein n=1 Tax=Haematococcus lacustris TaxID=44745 RepID=A0A699YTT3_HAELA|nr:uncharacterized protein HaLaN_01110 [Haematococcus lacustris]
MTKADNDSRVIARKLLIFVTCFYLTYYLVSIVAVGSSRAGWSELGRFPFRINKEDFNPGGSGPALAPASVTVRVTRKTWDYMASTAILHWVLCCLVNLTFPTNWIWWATLLLGSLLLSIIAEIVIYRLRDLREIALDS